ncbi:hypothetical protein GCM10012286_26560 [Streptomyces lasiicapitis]|uniref:Uncharacterized protein n=1 Tax=Streptomyces lasiicapitis TaxID=1923961 RepID=A0ABQ2LU75_9ACTN|nr:hypothetical protein GCM10012286_26560 [Streptomyces lasiicapitis]
MAWLRQAGGSAGSGVAGRAVPGGAGGGGAGGTGVGTRGGARPWSPPCPPEYGCESTVPSVLIFSMSAGARTTQ